MPLASDNRLETLDDILGDGEILTVTWSPSIWAFARRFVFVGLLTALFIGGATFGYGLLVWLSTTAVAIVVYGFVFDDYAIWLQHRRDIWALTNRRLIYIEDGEYLDALSVPLTDIDTISRGFWGALIIRLENRQKITVSFLATPKQAKTAISNAIIAAKGGAS